MCLILVCILFYCWCLNDGFLLLFLVMMLHYLAFMVSYTGFQDVLNVLFFGLYFHLFVFKRMFDNYNR